MEEIFHPPNLILSADVIPNDQLIRGVLAANATGGSFDRLAFSVMQGGWNCIKLADESGPGSLGVSLPAGHEQSRSKERDCSRPPGGRRQSPTSGSHRT
jgi:hypothetical protein